MVIKDVHVHSQTLVKFTDLGEGSQYSVSLCVAVSKVCAAVSQCVLLCLRVCCCDSLCMCVCAYVPFPVST